MTRTMKTRNDRRQMKGCQQDKDRDDNGATRTGPAMMMTERTMTEMRKR